MGIKPNKVVQSEDIRKRFNKSENNYENWVLDFLKTFESGFVTYLSEEFSEKLTQVISGFRKDLNIKRELK